ncbi:MAG: glutathione S-transferase [Deltaproteobacteria bacterium]|nr:glutathione S-transferase [Deltaproteobacteria bacterium]
MIPAYTLYGAAISLYTGKARAYLRYRNVPFVEEAGRPEIFERVGFRMIPVLHTPDDELIQDTTVIIDHLEARLAEAGSGDASIYPAGRAQRLVALLFEVYGDEWLLIPAMHYRWAYNLDFILEEFGKTVIPEASPEEQRALGEKISAPFRGSLPILGITDDTTTGIELDYERLLRHLNAHFANHRYLLGSRPSIGDYGLMGPLYAHNYRDPWSGDQMRRIAPNVARWVGSMNTPAPNSGRFLPDDEIPETLLPLLEVMFDECMPTLMATIDANAAWIESNPDTAEIPRGVGEHEFVIGGARGKRMIRSYSQWMLQRPLDDYRSLEGEDRERVDRLFESVGGKDWLQRPIQRRVGRRNNRLVPE